MILTLRSGAKKDDVKRVLDKIKSLGFTPHISEGAERTLIGVIGENAIATKDVFEGMQEVESITPISKPYKLVSREFKKKDSIIDVHGVKIGGKGVVVMAGPCSIETQERTLKIARDVKEAGAQIFRGGAFKPRTSPYSFQGLGEQGLKFLSYASKRAKIPVVTEVMAPQQVKLVERYADILQVGARNIQNFDLLKEVGKSSKPVFLKRGMATTIEEFLMSAEYIMTNGNYNVILCERGIRTFERSTRFTLDLNAVPVIKHLSHLPIFVDPSHGVGVREYIPHLARAAVACGADGVMIEVHSAPAEALCDGPQALLPVQFAALMKELKVIAAAIGRTL